MIQVKKKIILNVNVALPLVSFIKSFSSPVSLSGWKTRDNFLYAFLISLEEALWNKQMK